MKSIGWDRAGRIAAIAVLPCWVLAVAGFGLALDDYSQLRHPVALLGATGIAHALAFDLLGFVLPGALAALAALAVFGVGGTKASWSHRVGVQLLFLSGLAFAAMGLFPLDPTNLEARASQWHASAWLLWEVSFIPGALALGAAVVARDRGLAWLCWGVAGVLLVTGFTPLLPAPLAQRLGFAAWAAWFGLAAPRWPGRA